MIHLNNTARGFTLLEMLVALAIFAIIGIASYSGLRSVLQARVSIEAESQRLAQVQMALYFLERDIEQILFRPIRDEYGQVQPALAGDENNDPLLEFTRSGWDNPLQQQRARLQRVHYRLTQNTLLRGYWQTLDRGANNAIRETELLTRIDGVQIRFLAADNRWQRRWPPADQTEAATAELPRALEITLELNDWGEITRLFRLVSS